MYEYCGCQNVEVIAELTAEHDELRNLGHDLAKAANDGDLAAAQPIAAAMRDLLGPHTEVEERGLFPALADVRRVVAAGSIAAG
jgi:hemerythrin-like domain-containing protein